MPRCGQKYRKGWDFYFLNDSEKGKLLGMLLWLGSSKLEFYGE